MPPIAGCKRIFLAELADCRTLYRHCLTPVGPHSNAGVEAAFLQKFKAWEALLERCTIGFMSGRLRCDGLSVVCHVSALSEEAARRVLLQDRPFLEWTDPEKIFARWDAIFPAPSAPVSALRPALVELKHMKTIRNAIAHSSQAATDRFHVLVQSQFGGGLRLARPALFLTRAYPLDPSRTFFDRYADVIEVAGTALTG